MNLFFRALALLLLFLWFSSGFALAQNGLGRPVGIPVQLPVVSVFNIETAVSVPDGGTMSLGGVSRYSSGRSSRGIPGVGGPLFQNRGMGYSSGGSHAVVTATIFSNNEIGEALLTEGDRRARIRECYDPNGTLAVQAKADFISRNIGRSRK